jgi:PhzF family phenazine biosynthesis protein
MKIEIPIYQIDAFTGRVFSGNPAAVCPLEEWLDDSVMQSIATENNLSETAFFVKEKEGYRIRWFTPVREVDLCGHATLASGFVFFKYIGPDANKVEFNSNSGLLSVTRDGEYLSLDFPAQPPKPCEAPPALLAGLRKEPSEVLCSEDFLVVYPSERDIVELRPNFSKLNELGLRGVIVTAKGDTVDFVSRFFAPTYGIDEDPVTGSAHCELTPFWSERLKKNELHALQLSKRGGELFCKMAGDRVIISGQAVEYMSGKIAIEK